MTARAFQKLGSAQLVRQNGESFPVTYCLLISREIIIQGGGQPSLPGMVSVSGVVDFEGQPPFDALGETLELQYEEGGSSQVLITDLGKRSNIEFSDAGILKSQYFNE